MDCNFANTEAMVRGEKSYNRHATRWAVNHNWCFRGDNTKYKEKK